RVGRPLVSFRETLRRRVRVEGECVRQAGTAGLFAKVNVDFEPFKGEQPVTVVSRVDPEVLPGELVAAAEQGIRGALLSGELGYPVINVRATITGGEMDRAASSEG